MIHFRTMSKRAYALTSMSQMTRNKQVFTNSSYIVLPKYGFGDLQQERKFKVNDYKTKVRKKPSMTWYGHLFSSRFSPSSRISMPISTKVRGERVTTLPEGNHDMTIWLYDGMTMRGENRMCHQLWPAGKMQSNQTHGKSGIILKAEQTPMKCWRSQTPTMSHLPNKAAPSTTPPFLHPRHLVSPLPS